MDNMNEWVGTRLQGLEVAVMTWKTHAHLIAGSFNVAIGS